MHCAMYRENKGYLSCYASGDGALHFVWSNKEGIAQGIQVVRADVVAYLKTKHAKHLREKGYRIAQVNCQWNLVAAVDRVDADHLTLEGRTYYYTLAPVPPNADSLRVMHALIVKTDTEVLGEVEVKHWGTLGSIAHFLANEDVLTQAVAPTGC